MVYSDLIAVPTRAPINFKGMNTSSYSINVTWEPIESQYRHGIILGYNVTYKSRFDAGIYMVDVVGRSNLTTGLHNLRNYTYYDITVAGYNSKGDGSFATITVRTEETGQFAFVFIPAIIVLKILLEQCYFAKET